MSDPEIICEIRGAAGFVTLNRPRALNALTHGMVAALAAALDRWEADPAVTRVVVTGAGDRAFCAGGDIRLLYEAGRAGEVSRSLAFWRDEYRLNIRIKRYPKPYVSLIDGIVMGGGVGVSLPGSHRVAGDRYRLAMPEVGIGFFPDVGAAHALARLPGGAGAYIAVTGASIGPQDGGALGLATHVFASEDLPALEAGLVAGEPVDAVLAARATPPAGGPVAAERAVIDHCFAEDSVPGVLDSLDQEAAAGSAFARDTATTIRTKAPSSLAIALEQIRRARTLSFEEVIASDFRIVSRIAAGHDFYEGVRATIIDKDGAPRWRPDRLSGLAPDFVESHFTRLETGDFEEAG